jgi:hypothetical protein
MPSDELWMELTELDARLGDGIWDGTIPPDEAPPWSHRLGALVVAARGPAAPDELEREEEILADMLAVASPDAEDDHPSSRRCGWSAAWPRSRRRRRSSRRSGRPRPRPAWS